MYAPGGLYLPHYDAFEPLDVSMIYIPIGSNIFSVGLHFSLFSLRDFQELLTELGLATALPQQCFM